MAFAYDKDGWFIGMIVENLTDGPTDECNPNREAYGTMGQYFPSRAIDEFQRMVADSQLVYGLRKVFHHIHGTVEQVLVNGIDDELIWINCRMTPTVMASNC